ncbi:ferredoxin reductase family protein [Pseudonocardia humida]|uniref:Ferredoxin reductase family protein n=1 Tax=Pseudonocardia humida TaxID=2800819 RepID=A0ABT0ZXA1_9PSEU|nr:ferredoxin reductase family protein [Pseudonocardia humida]MCO1655382.1 ferredoxin reductase family protein [Pseudonocardia humida]
MEQRQLRAIWLAGFAVIVIAPSLLWLSVPPSVTGNGIRRISLWSNLSVVTGLLATSAMVCVVVLPSRIRSLNRAFGIENIIDLHRFLGIVTASLVLLHLACVVAADPTNTALLNFPEAPGRAQNATIATFGLVAIVLLAILRRKFDLSYEFWRTSHLALAVVVLITSAMHIVLLNQLMNDPTFALVLTALAVAVVLVFAYRWIWRNIYDQSTEFLVRDVRLENPTVATLVLEPKTRNRDGSTTSWAFAPGQFAWIRLDRSATGQEHPFTIASSAHDEFTEFTIRGAGDFTRRIRRLQPGQPVWVDGPHGAFTSDLTTASAGFVLMAGGVGITPMLSMVRTAAHRGDPRPYRLVVVASAPEDLFFRDELATLRRYIDLEVTEVLRRPRPDWSGPIGGINSELMGLVVGDIGDPQDLDYFICGPPGMVVDAMNVLDEMSVPADRVHTEQFDFV